jgi:hypothetical protein
VREGEETKMTDRNRCDCYACPSTSVVEVWNKEVSKWLNYQTEEGRKEAAWKESKKKNNTYN